MNKLFKFLYRKRSEYYAGLIKKYIREKDRILDIGAGSGYIAEILSKNADITLLDVKDYNQTNLPLKIYDGKKIPYKDKSFDAALLLTVFHYIKDQPGFLKDVKRVCNRIILIDDVYKTRFGWLMVNFNDSIISNSVGIYTKFNFLTEKEFKSLFRALKLKIVDSKEIRSFLRLTKQKIYVLENG
mgnify:FL=1